MSAQLFRRVLRRIFRRTIVSEVVQSITVGGVLAFITAQILMHNSSLAMQIQLTLLSQK
jgi:hypothetical protein